ncbi:hypothetical protein [Piscirickettsia salmonis]|nr:hypothetical protein [Piscirickettsia salmonis]
MARSECKCKLRIKVGQKKVNMLALLATVRLRESKENMVFFGDVKT